MEKNRIDLVVPWVDGNDPIWRAQRKEYASMHNHLIREGLYRDWRLLRYWFRGVEKNLPWIRKIHFITWGHLPPWLNTNHPKLNIVRHEDYLPAAYLPTFSSIPIEINVHRIEGLAECFITANDDTFFVGAMDQEDFFQEGIPCDCFLLEPITELCKDGFGHILWNNIACINRHFDLEGCRKQYEEKWFADQYDSSVLEQNKTLAFLKRFPGFGANHYPNAVLKSVYEEVWKEEYRLLDQTSRHGFRSPEDISNWLMRYWQLASGRFTPHMQRGREAVVVGTAPKQIRDVVLKAENRVICINEGGEEVDFESRAKYIRELFEMRLPEMSSYEKF